MSSALRFTKGHGTHNDFVLLLDPDGAINLSAALARGLCDRRGGIGADGVIRAVRAHNFTPQPGEPDPSAGAPPDMWVMDYWNADGTTSEMCGNGARVFGALLERDAGVDVGAGLDFVTRGGRRRVTALGAGNYAIQMGTWSVDPGGVGAIGVEAPGLVGARDGLPVDVGNPHVVVALDGAAALAGIELTAPPRLTPEQTAGANVEFAVLGTVSDGVGSVAMRVHERGSGETMSCGTGACAVAIAARQWAGPEAPDDWRVEVPGGVLTVRIAPDSVVLEGPAVLVADGTVDTDSL